MFQIGQKVRGKEWLNIPEELQNTFSIGAVILGKTGEIRSFEGRINGINTYMVLIENANFLTFFFEPELEPLIRVGEQLLFWEL